MFGLRERSYAPGVALLPKGALDSKRTATAAVIVSFIGLIVIPVLTVPAMFLVGIGWHGAPRWARMTLIVSAILFAAYLVAVKPAAPVVHHG
jgi:hypothetical protein